MERPAEPVRRSLEELLDVTLPLNRKERFYTGTVLPAIVCCNDLEHVGRLAGLLGAGPVTVRADPGDCTVVVFTEYGVAESLHGPSAGHVTDLPDRQGHARRRHPGHRAAARAPRA